jgi:hypothetical protein
MIYEFSEFLVRDDELLPEIIDWAIDGEGEQYDSMMLGTEDESTGQNMWDGFQAGIRFIKEHGANECIIVWDKYAANGWLIECRLEDLPQEFQDGIDHTSPPVTRL